MYTKLKIMLTNMAKHDKQDAVRFNVQDIIDPIITTERFYSTRLLHYSMCNCVWTSHR